MDHDARVCKIHNPVRSAESGEQVPWSAITKCSVATNSHRHVKEHGRRDGNACGLLHLGGFGRWAFNGVLQTRRRYWINWENETKNKIKNYDTAK